VPFVGGQHAENTFTKVGFHDMESARQRGHPLKEAQIVIEKWCIE
jgi:hypothetical protein